MLRRKFTHWLSVLDQEQQDALVDLKVWLFILTTFVVIISAASFAPIAGPFFELDFSSALICLAPVAVCALLISSDYIRQTLSLSGYGVLMLVTSATFQLFMWSLVCYSQLPGATVMAALPILLAAYHGEFFQLSSRHPWGGLTIICAVVGALFISPDADHDAIISIGGVIALGAATTMGNHAHIKRRALKERDSLKAAVDAQTILDSVQEVEKKQALIYEIRGTNHDAGNALSGILMNLDLLSQQLNRPSLDLDEKNELKEMSQDLSESTAHLRALIEKGREAGKKAEADESANLETVATQASREAQSQLPDVSFDITLSPDLVKNPFIKLHGGELTLHRVLSNLLINAGEGNGKQSASHVKLSITNNEGQLVITVTDNGPGFKPEQIQTAFSQLKTTKENGTGLGLYTSQRLIAANRGSIQYKNKPEGGAEVCVSLPNPLA